MAPNSYLALTAPPNAQTAQISHLIHVVCSDDVNPTKEIPFPCVVTQ